MIYLINSNDTICAHNLGTDLLVYKMKKTTYLLLFLCSLSPSVNASERIISSGSNITEIIYALGAGDQVVGSDKTSTSPSEAKANAILGHPSQLSIEGIISLRPTLFISDDKYLDTTLNHRLERSGTKTLILKQAKNINELNIQIQKISNFLNKSEQGEILIKSLDTELNELSMLRETRKPPFRKAIFLYGKDSLVIAGKKTPVDFLMNMAGVINPASFEGVKPMTPESIIIINPDVIITVDKALSNDSDKDRFFSIPAISATPAGKNRRITTIPISHTNLGINTMKTAKKLFIEIYGK